MSEINRARAANDPIAREFSWAVTFKNRMTGAPRIVRVRALSAGDAVDVAQHLERLAPGVSLEVVRCMNLELDQIHFHGWRMADGDIAVGMSVEHQLGELPLRLDLHNHSPSGFEWGSPGSGPAQLALAVCSQVLGDDHALRCYQRVKDRLIATIHEDTWMLSAAAIEKAAASAPD